MNIAHIVACSNNSVIGIGKDIPWKSKIDLNFFKEKTEGHVCIVGRKTYETIAHLKNRHFIVLSRNKVDGVSYCDNIEDALTLARSLTEDTIYIVGGAEIYNASFKYVDTLFVTIINIDVAGDAFYKVPKDFDIEYNSLPILDKDFTINFTTYKRKEA